jgi:hypothetical protein
MTKSIAFDTQGIPIAIGIKFNYSGKRCYCRLTCQLKYKQMNSTARFSMALALTRPWQVTQDSVSIGGV